MIIRLFEIMKYNDVVKFTESRDGNLYCLRFGNTLHTKPKF